MITHPALTRQGTRDASPDGQPASSWARLTCSHPTRPHPQGYDRADLIRSADAANPLLDRLNSDRPLRRVRRGAVRVPRHPLRHLRCLVGVRAGGLGVVAVLGVLRVDINGKVLAFLLVAEIAIAVVFDVVMVANPAGGEVSFATLSPAHLWAAGIGAALVTAVTGFVGFEATVVFSEETRDPKRTIARATYIAVAITGVLYGLSAWAMSVATGPDHIVDAATADGTELIFNLVSPHVWPIPDRHRAHAVRHQPVRGAAVVSQHGRPLRVRARPGTGPARRARPHQPAQRRTAHGVDRPDASSPWSCSIGYAASGVDPLVYLFFWITVDRRARRADPDVAHLGRGGRLLLPTRQPGDGVAAGRRARARGVGLGTVLVATLAQFDILLGVDARAPRGGGSSPAPTWWWPWPAWDGR